MHIINLLTDLLQLNTYADIRTYVHAHVHVDTHTYIAGYIHILNILATRMFRTRMEQLASNNSCTYNIHTAGALLSIFGIS